MSSINLVVLSNILFFLLTNVPVMAFTKKLSASWSLITSSKRLSRSSQAVSIVDKKAFIFGGELLPRQPVDNRVDVINLGSAQGKHHSPYRYLP